jgi:hypothetical protein
MTEATSSPSDPNPPAAPALTGLSGGWQVEPSEVAAFVSAVQRVRDNLNTVFSQADQLTSPAYLPQLGTSPVGQSLTAKFTDRLSGGQGLLEQLNTALSHIDDFVATAERTAARYVGTDAGQADRLRAT